MPVCQGPCGQDLPVTAFDLAGNSRLRAKGHRRTKCRKCRDGGSVSKPPDAPIKRFTRPLEGVKRFLITSAQNATSVNILFWSALQVAAKAMGAEIVVIPYRYKNPTGWTNEKEAESEEWWDPEIEPYLYNARKKLCDNLILAADVRIQATSSNPLTGFESLTGGESCIIGHPKMQLRSVPVPHGKYPKILTTTGACTGRNLSETKAGALAKFHHFLGGLVVEVSGKHFRIRQINADRVDGSFIDCEWKYSCDGVEAAPPAEALVMGDIHERHTDKGVDRATFGPKGIVETLKPKKVVAHDLLDGDTVNPHHKGDPFIAASKIRAGLTDVRAEVESAVKYLKDRQKGRDFEWLVVPSNHDNFLARWVRDTDWKANPGNAAFYLETAQAMLASVRRGPGGAEYDDPFIYWVNKLKGDAKITALKMDESHTIMGIEVGQHGNYGPNGSPGTLKNLSRLGTRMISGHTHAPGIEEGHYKTGTSTPLKLEYTHGPSSWLQCHCVVYASGKRALLVIVGDQWRIDP